MIRCLGALGLALVATPLAAAEAPATAAAAVFPVLQMLIALAVVVAAILGTAWLLRRFGPTPLGAGGAMRVLGGVAVGPRERLLLVEIGETWLVVGVAPGRVSAVHAMPRPENAGEVEATTQTSPFAHRLKAMLAGRRD
ncbi:MAG: flagellar biosynthetic protein FliO [Burkholderiales bacterium]|jgi:flagellar protein FliO/FliZ|nr:flagellar biosynthetic protein FliO [Burkholderiales bacterium]